MINETISFVLENPVSIGQIALSFALVVTTLAYTVYTKRQTEEMERTREQSNQPVVKGGIKSMGAGRLNVVIKNTGNGAAHNVSAKMYFEDIDSNPIHSKISILSPEEEYEFAFPLEDDERLTTGM
jgi:hypothetical protein